MNPRNAQLFDQALPGGLLYRPDFLTPADEGALAAEIGTVTFAAFEMRGVVARRRVAFFGASYERTTSPPLPPFLLALRAAVAELAHVEPGAITMALINEYPPGAPIGWHRDAPQYDIVAGVSLLSACRMKFRPYLRPGTGTSIAPQRRAGHEITLEPRSAYVMRGAARTAYEHHIPAVASLRYSITFRTLRSPGGVPPSNVLPQR